MNQAVNRAAWLAARGQALTVSDADMPAPAEGEMLLRIRALGINPFDRVVQTLGGMVSPWLSYPAILGSDVAGEVVAVGPLVTRFHVGDRVLGLALGMDKLANRAAEGAFQEYVIVRQDAATRLPDTVSFEAAAVLPLGIATAACGLFLEDKLGLRAPTIPPAPPTGKTVLIWGGSTSVGSCAIQLAVAAGYEVVTTASPGNFAYVRQLGASAVFDYRDRKAVDGLVRYLAGRDVVGALAIASGSGAPCIDVIGRCQGRRIVAMASAPLALDDAPLGGQFSWKLTRLPRLLFGFAALAVRARLKRVATRAIWGTALMQGTLGPAIFRDFLEPALACGSIVPAPPPLVAGRGLAALPEAMELLRRGVSARKVVVAL
jgi:NADPH:quinone reductase-like Zn-dependent oxidoreductase